MSDLQIIMENGIWWLKIDKIDVAGRDSFNEIVEYLKQWDNKTGKIYELNLLANYDFLKGGCIMKIYNELAIEIDLESRFL